MIEKFEDDTVEAIGIFVFIGLIVVAFLIYSGLKGFDVSGLLNSLKNWLGGLGGGVGKMLQNAVDELQSLINRTIDGLTPQQGSVWGNSPDQVITGTSVGNMNPPETSGDETDFQIPDTTGLLSLPGQAIGTDPFAGLPPVDLPHIG